MLLYSQRTRALVSDDCAAKSHVSPKKLEAETSAKTEQSRRALSTRKHSEERVCELSKRPLNSLELFLLDKTAAIVVQDGEGLLHILGALLGEATSLEELLGAEGVWCWRRTENSTVSIWCRSGLVLFLFFFHQTGMNSL